MPLTVIQIQHCKPQCKLIKLFDGRGLYIEITPTGSRWWRFQYRFAGKEKRISLGVYPDVGLKEAREHREQARKQVANGIDPSEQRRMDKLAIIDKTQNTFEAVAREWWAQRTSSWAAGQAQRVIRRFEIDVFHWIGARSIRDLRAPELLSVLRRIESRGVLETAHRVLQSCGQVFRYALATGRADRDISADLRGALQPCIDSVAR